MLSRRLLSVLFAIFVFPIAACGGTNAVVALGGGDAGVDAMVQGGMDSGKTADGGHVRDAAKPLDATKTSDGGGPADATQGTDVSPPVDASTGDTGDGASSRDTGPTTFTIGGSITGLSGSVTLSNGNGGTLTLTANGSFAFPMSVDGGTSYDVTVTTQPSSPLQTCTVTNGMGTIMGGSADVSIACTTNTFAVGGMITGLATGDSVVLADNGGDNLSVSTNGAFTFATPIASGAGYAITVVTQPGSPAETCVVTMGSGPITNAAVSSVTIACTINTYTIGGMLVGLVTGSHVVLTDNGGDNLTLNTNGAFTFATPVASGQPYLVAVATQPGGPEYETCVVSAGGSNVGSGNVTTVTVNCTPNTFTISGKVTGLSGTVTLSNNEGPNLLVTTGAFSFPAAVTSGQPYSVAVVSSPSTPVSQVCTVVTGTGSGTVIDANIGTVEISCTTNTYTIGGKLSGIATGESVTLSNNGGDGITIKASGSFTFATPIDSGTTYTVTATSPTSPIAQSCVVTGGTGPVINANISSVVVTCTTLTFTVGGSVSGLATGDSVTLVDNATNATVVTTDTAFTFTTAIASGAKYAVTVSVLPTNPAQACTVANGMGTIVDANVTNVSVVCTTGEGAACKVDSDCTYGWCSDITSTCVAGQSCKAAQAYVALGTDKAAGIDSCGPGESTDTPAPTHESCCRSLLLPTGTDGTNMRMDKYEVTTGRVRQFVEAINALEGGYNLRLWAETEVTNGTPTGALLSAQMSNAVIAFLPTSNVATTSLDLPAQLGATSMDANFPSAYQGCYMADGAYGAGDYWQPETTLTSFDSPTRSFAQADYDIKSMNCGTYWIYAAFCAWDGGRLPTLAEVEAVWGGGQYPWTTVSGAAAPFWPSVYPYNTVTIDGTTNYYATIPSPSTKNTVNWNNNSFNNNPGDFYFFPNKGTLTDEPTAVDTGADLTPYIAAPGRFILDVTSLKSTSFAGTEGWQDLAANMMEITEESSTTGTATFCDCGAYTSAEGSALPACTCPAPGSNPATKPGVVRSTTLPTAPWVGGSWEGHVTADPHDPPYFSVHSYDQPLQTQYGKAGFRCVRPAP